MALLQNLDEKLFPHLYHLALNHRSRRSVEVRTAFRIYSPVDIYYFLLISSCSLSLGICNFCLFSFWFCVWTFFFVISDSFFRFLKGYELLAT